MAKVGRPRKDELRHPAKKSLEKCTKYIDGRTWKEPIYKHSSIDGEGFVGSVFDSGSQGFIASLKAWRLVDD